MATEEEKDEKEDLYGKELSTKEYDPEAEASDKKLDKKEDGLSKFNKNR